MASSIPFGPSWFMIGSLIIGFIAAVQFVFPIVSYPNISLSLQFNQTDKRISELTVNNYGNAIATNVLLTLDAPSNFITKKIFSSENYTITQESQNLLQLSIPRLSNGQGSIITIYSVVNSSTISNENYTVYLTHDRGSVKIQSPDTTIKTVKKQAPSFQEIISIIPLSGLIGYFAIRFFQVAIILNKRHERKSRIIGFIVFGCVFSVFVLILILSVLVF